MSPVKLKPAEQEAMPPGHIELFEKVLAAAKSGTLVAYTLSCSMEFDGETDEHVTSWWNKRRNYSEAIGDVARLQHHIVKEADDPGD